MTLSVKSLDRLYYLCYSRLNTLLLSPDMVLEDVIE